MKLLPNMRYIDNDGNIWVTTDTHVFHTELNKTPTLSKFSLAEWNTNFEEYCEASGTKIYLDKPYVLKQILEEDK